MIGAGVRTMPNNDNDGFLSEFITRPVWPLSSSPAQPAPEAVDMRRKQEDGTWIDGDYRCLDVLGAPIKSGPCVAYIYPNVLRGTLLGVGKDGTWRVRLRKSGAVRQVASLSLIIGGGTRSAALGLCAAAGWRPPTDIIDRGDKFIRRVNAWPLERRINLFCAASDERHGAELNVDLDGNLLDPRQNRTLFNVSFPQEDITPAVALMRPYSDCLSLWVSTEDTRYTLCDNCECRRVSTSFVSVILEGYTRGLPQGMLRMCGCCLQSIRINTHYNERDCTVGTAVNGTVVFTLARPVVRIERPERVQSYAVQVENALPWIGESKTHMGFEIEGSAKHIGTLCTSLIKAKLAIGKSDSSISATGNRTSVEVVTTPISTEPKVYRKTLLRLCKYLEESDFAVNGSCGGHIHITAEAFTRGQIARLRYAFATLPTGWSLIFGRPFGSYCHNTGSFSRRVSAFRCREGDTPRNPLDALAIIGRGAIAPNTKHGTHEFRAFASAHTYDRLVANAETVLALQAWCASMPSDWSLPSYLRFLDAHALADAHSKALAHKRKGIKPKTVFDTLCADLDTSSPPLAYARALAASALIQIRMARVAKHRVEVDTNKPDMSKPRTALQKLVDRFNTAEALPSTYSIEQALYSDGRPSFSFEVINHGTLSNIYWCTVATRTIEGKSFDLVVRINESAAHAAPSNGTKITAPPAIDNATLSLAV